MMGGGPAPPGPGEQAPTPGPGAAGVSAQAGAGDAAPLPPPPQFDIEDSDSDEEVATVMMDVQGSDLSTAIQAALAKQQAADPGGLAPGERRLPTAPMNYATPPGGLGGLPATGTPLETAPMAAPGGQVVHGGQAIPGAAFAPHPQFELMVAEGEPENAGLKRALIVAVVLLVIVVAAVVLMYLGQEGVLSS
jgi:hypothetical protein